MYAKNIVTVTAFAALAEQALAFNSHRHLHRRDVDKRAIITDWVTVWETVTPGQEPEPAPTVFAANDAPAPTPLTTLVTAIQPAPQVQVPSSAPVIVSVPPVSQAPAPTPTVKATTPVSGQPTPTGGNNATNPVFAKKRGIAYNDPALANAFGATCEQCGWGYNWGSSAQGFSSKYDFIPTLWGPAAVHTSHWDSDVTKALAAGAKAIFSFNEPDNAGQANLSPQDAANGHIQYVNKYAGQALIGAPSITNSGNPGEGIQWLNNFMSACGGQCRVDFCNVHWYSEAEYADTLFSHLDAAHKACEGKPIWLTEFAPIGDQSKTPDFLRSVIPKLDSLDYLHGYSYFMVATGNLMASVDGLSSIGQLYATL